MSTLLPGKMILSKVLNFLRGDLTRRTMLFVLVPLIFAFYFGILGVAALLFPESYDWRNYSISRLLYARDNPGFHHIAQISVAVSGVLMIPFAGYIRRRLRDIAPTAATVGAVVFYAGCICLTLAGLITSHPAHGMARFPKLHDKLARLSAIGLGVGMLVFNACGTKGYFWPKPGKPLPRRSLMVSWNLLTLPLVLIVASWLVIRTFLKQSGPTYHAIVTSAAWKVGFWEWIGSPVAFLFLVCAVLFLPKNSSE
ncbi:MAG: hypothetical protein ABSG48_03575 [Geobacteraceae bacterium]